MAEPSVLVLNTTFKGIVLSVFSLAEDTPRSLATLFEAKSHSAALKLPELTTKVLADACIALDELAGIAVAHGPGSFTGIKIGLAFVQGLAAGTALPVLGCDPLACLGQHGAAAYRRHPWLLAQNRRKGYLYGSGQDTQTVWLVPKAKDHAKVQAKEQGHELWLAPLYADTAGDPGREPWPPSLTEVGLVSPWQELAAALPEGVATEAADPERFGFAANDAMAARFAAKLATGTRNMIAGTLKANYITPSTPEERQLEAKLAAAKSK